MQANPPHSLIRSPLGLLDCRVTLQAPPAITFALTCSNLLPFPVLLLADRLAELYEMIFPNHPEWLDEEVVDWEDEEDVAAAVECFLGRVCTLFPVHDDIWDIDLSADSEQVLEVVEWRLWEIPVMPLGYDEWYDGWDDLKEPASYLLHMRYSRRDEDSPYLHNEFEDLYPDHLTPRYLEPHHLMKTLRQVELPEPLDALPDLSEAWS